MIKKTLLCLIFLIPLKSALSEPREDSRRLTNNELQRAARYAQRAAETLLQEMSDREKLGQMLMLDIRMWKNSANGALRPVTKLNNTLSTLFQKYALGSVILFRENLGDAKQVISLVNDLQETAARIPLFVAVDQEGGFVTRLQEGTDFPGNMALAATRNASLAKKVGQVHGLELSALGVNINFAPVVDVNSNQNNPVIAIRAYSDNLALVSRMAESYVAGLEQFPVMATAKHFPGHGNVMADSHYGLPIVESTQADWRRIDLAPFLSGIKKGIQGIMTAHVALPALDSQQMRTKDGQMIFAPATLSQKILTGVLRNELKFDGLIFTDALDMGAIRNFFTPIQAAKHAISAGADILTMPIVVRSPADLARFDQFFTALEVQMEQDPVFAAKVDHAVRRILRQKFKMELNWKQPSTANARSIIGSREHKELEDHIANQSVTVLENERVLPYVLKRKQTILLLNNTDRRNETIRDEMQQIVRKMKKTSLRVISYKTDYTGALTNELQHAIEESSLILMCTENLTSTPPQAQKIINYSNDQNKKLVVIATRNPYDIAYLDNVNAYIAIYGIMGYDVTNASRNRLEANMRAAIRTILHHPNYPKLFNKPRGQLPVNILTPDQDSLLYPYGYGLQY
ncbi:MAG: glycoside hydrolase family 3 protein [Spirochaetia bacterium]